MGDLVIMIACAAALLLICHVALIQPIFLSPLAKLPSAHWSAPISSLWVLAARKLGRENKLLHSSHKRLGPVVRIGPNDVSVDGPDAIRVVYQGGFEKDPWYAVFDNYGCACELFLFFLRKKEQTFADSCLQSVPCMFSARSSHDHSARKRMISHVYSKSSLQKSAAAKAQARIILFERLLPALRDSRPIIPGRGAALDIHSLFLATTMDFIAAYIFGLKNATNFIQDRGYRNHWLELYNARNDHHFWPQELPGLTGLFKRFGVWLYPAWVDDSNAELAAWNMDLCKRTTKAQERNPESVRGTADEPVVYDALNAGIDKEIRTKGAGSILYSTVMQNRDISVASELFDHVLAGQETAGITLTYLSWHLSKDLKLQALLREELLTLSPSFEIPDKGAPTLPDARSLDALPLLNAIIMETLRLHAPLPGPQARRSPSPSCTINGIQIPGGVRIAAMAHSLHRDEEAFPDAGKWDHTRWLATDEELRERHRRFWAFSSGGRTCIGSNFAMNGTLPLPQLTPLAMLTEVQK